MRERGVSQVVIAVTDELPLAAKEVVGTAIDWTSWNFGFKDPSMLDRPIEAVMGRSSRRSAWASRSNP